MEEAELLGLWTEKHLRSIRACHISGAANSQVDLLSRTTIDQGEWQLNPAIFNEITLRFGIPAVDLFVSNTNAQTSRFFSRFPTPGAEGVDALQSRWPPGLLYAFPPLAIISKVVRKLLSEKAELILITPYWPCRPWFADLLSLSVAPPWHLPRDKRALSQGTLLHTDVDCLKLTAWRLSGNS